MPKCFRDCVLLPIQKGKKDATCSQNYRPIALASSQSKVLIGMKYETFFWSKSLQFGFKPGYSASLCTTTVRNVVSRYMHNGTAVLRCSKILDASKAFDMVDQGIPRILLERGLPLPVLRFMLSWYCTQ